MNEPNSHPQLGQGNSKALNSSTCPEGQKGMNVAAPSALTPREHLRVEVSISSPPFPAEARPYLSVLGAGAASSTLLTEHLICSSPAWALGRNSGCSCILPLCISEVLFGGLGGGGVCSGGGSRSSLESSFHCSFREGQTLLSFSLLSCSNFKLYHGRIFILYLSINSYIGSSFALKKKKEKTDTRTPSPSCIHYTEHIGHVSEKFQSASKHLKHKIKSVLLVFCLP